MNDSIAVDNNNLLWLWLENGKLSELNKGLIKMMQALTWHFRKIKADCNFNFFTGRRKSH